MIWTQAMRDKSIATRLAKKQHKESGAPPKVEVVKSPEVVAAKTNGFDWNTIPLSDAMNKLADMKREYDRVAAIVMRRQTVPRPTWTCWSQLHKELVPKSVMSICRKGGDDGKWAFRDDGVFEIRDGLRIPNPAFCCNSFCYAVYQKSQPMAALSRR